MLRLPKWKKTDDGWRCKSELQMQFAFMCQLSAGLSLPAFDTWLSGLPDCPMKAELMDNRTEACEAFRAGNNDRALRYLEVMHAAKKYDSREQFLLPMARRDKKRQDGTKKERNPDITKWIKDAIKRNPDKTRDELWQMAPDKITDQIGYDRFLKRVSAARQKSKK